MVRKWPDFPTLEAVVEAFGGGIWDYCVSTGKLECNRRWHEIFGLDYDKCKVTNGADLRSYVHPDDIDSVTCIDRNEVEDLFDTGEPYRRDFHILLPSGEVRWIRSVATILRQEQTGGYRAIGCITDITEFQEAANDTGPELPSSEQRIDDELAEQANAQLLTSRERECLLWVSLGKTAWESATILDISPRTVEFHLANAITKLGASNKVHAVAIALRDGAI